MFEKKHLKKLLCIFSTCLVVFFWLHSEPLIKKQGFLLEKEAIENGNAIVYSNIDGKTNSGPRE
jgi:hypothetical protein